MTWHASGPLFDVRQPNAARIYDYLIGGKDNFASDHEAAARLLELLPHVARACRDNRAFLRRAVRFLAGQGIRQFIDIGSGHGLDLIEPGVVDITGWRPQNPPSLPAGGRPSPTYLYGGIARKGRQP